MYFILAENVNTTSNIIAAVGSLVTALGVLFTALGIFIPMARTLRTVHTIVNQQRTDAQRYNIALTELLRKNGIEVPIDQSLPVSGLNDADKPKV